MHSHSHDDESEESDEEEEVSNTKKPSKQKKSFKKKKSAKKVPAKRQKKTRVISKKKSEVTKRKKKHAWGIKYQPTFWDFWMKDRVPDLSQNDYLIFMIRFSRIFRVEILLKSETLTFLTYIFDDDVTLSDLIDD